MVQIKICGITSIDDARSAMAAGVDMLGFNFYRPSPRYVEPDTAREIIAHLRTSPPVPVMVGVFVNEDSAETIARMVNDIGLDAVQLHGDEPAEFCSRLKSLLKGRTIIKVFRVDEHFDLEGIKAYQVDAVMLDAFHPKLRGGTGQSIDWGLALRARKDVRKLFLAGGLSSENVAEAIRQVKPEVVDACTSLESSPGRKDITKITAFVRAVRSG